MPKFFFDDFSYSDLKPAIESHNERCSLLPTVSLECVDLGHWDQFYNLHEGKFFFPRAFLLCEFPELSSCERVLECGFGNGSNLSALLKDSKAEVFGCEVSVSALNCVGRLPNFVDFVKSGRLKTFLWNLALHHPPFELPVMDAVILFFVCSANLPQNQLQMIKHAVSTLRVGGCVCFRDYAIGDVAQLRAPDAAILTPSSHVRPDGTLSYFFSVEEVTSLLEAGGLEVEECTVHTVENKNRRSGISLKRAFIHAKGVRK